MKIITKPFTFLPVILVVLCLSSHGVAQMQTVSRPAPGLSSEKETPLHAATRAGNIDKIKELVKAGASINARKVVVFKEIETLSLSGMGSKNEKKERNGMSALHIAASDPALKPEVLKYLLDLGANPGITCDIADLAAQKHNDEVQEKRKKAIEKIGHDTLIGIPTGPVPYQPLKTPYKRDMRPFDVASSLEKMDILEEAMRRAESNQNDNTTVETQEFRDIKAKAENGDMEARFDLAECYKNGKGISPSKFEAVKWYRLAAEQGHVKAQHYMGSCHWRGEGSAKKSDEEAVKWYRLAANQGYADAQYMLGTFYYQGWSVPLNEEEAVKWFRLAAKQGHTSALKTLRMMNER